MRCTTFSAFSALRLFSFSFKAGPFAGWSAAAPENHLTWLALSWDWEGVVDLRVAMGLEPTCCSFNNRIALRHILLMYLKLMASLSLSLLYLRVLRQSRALIDGFGMKTIVDGFWQLFLSGQKILCFLCLTHRTYGGRFQWDSSMFQKIPVVSLCCQWASTKGH